MSLFPREKLFTLDETSVIIHIKSRIEMSLYALDAEYLKDFDWVIAGPSLEKLFEEVLAESPADLMDKSITYRPTIFMLLSSATEEIEIKKSLNDHGFMPFQMGKSLSEHLVNEAYTTDEADVYLAKYQRRQDLLKNFPVRHLRNLSYYQKELLLTRQAYNDITKKQIHFYDIKTEHIFGREYKNRGWTLVNDYE